MQKQTRHCTHAGDWYPSNPSKLSHQIHELLSKVHVEHHGIVKAIIAPHGSLAQSGSTSAVVYKHLIDSNIEQIFIFGPFHRRYISGCTVTAMEQLQTPLGCLSIDIQTVNKLKQQNFFHLIDLDKDEEEHSIEMHLNFIFKIFGKRAKIIPILTGSFEDQMLEEYTKTLLPYFQDPKTLFIISTDFCHYDQHPHSNSKSKEHELTLENISTLDHVGIKLIQAHDYKGFKEYIHHTKSTICGRDSLQIFLKIINSSSLNLSTKFVKYIQTEQKVNNSNHIISFASAVTFQKIQ